MGKRIFLYAAGLSAAVALISTWRMLDLYASDELWGHWPLILFASIWLSFGLVILSQRKYSNLHLRWMSLASAAAAFLALGFPPFPTTFTLFIGFVPLFFLEREIQGADSVKKPIQVTAFYAYFSFVLWNIFCTYWVANTALIAGVVAILANSLLMLLPWLTFVLFRKYVGDRTAYFSFVAFWICFEYLHMQWEVTWPWLTLGNSLSQYVWLPQWYCYTGVFGGSFWILMGNVFIYELLQRYKSGGLSNRRKISLILWIVVPVVISVIMYNTYEPKGEEQEVVIIQPNFEPHYQKFSIPGSVQVDRFLDLSKKSLTDQTDYLLFPETAFDNVNIDQLNNNYEISQIRSLIVDYPGLHWVTGLSAHKIYPRFVPGKRNLRTSVRGDQNIYWEAYNSAIQTNHRLEDLQLYLKSKLVPGPEIFPYKEQLFFLKALIESLEGTVEGLATQPDRAVFSAQKYSIAPVICYESIFGEYCTEYVKNGANAIFIMTNDGWWDETPGHIQHLKFGTLRAIETRRDIARSANSGISCFVDQQGRIRQVTKYDEPTAIRGNIRMNDEITFYTQWGDVIGRLALFVSLFQLLYIVFGYIKQKYKVL